jgi:uncharacterized protein (DUF2342 family)
MGVSVMSETLNSLANKFEKTLTKMAEDSVEAVPPADKKKAKAIKKAAKAAKKADKAVDKAKAKQLKVDDPEAYKVLKADKKAKKSAKKADKAGKKAKEAAAKFEQLCK